MQKIEDNVYSVDGTPTDCVHLGVLWLFGDNPPDLVISGTTSGVEDGQQLVVRGRQDRPRVLRGQRTTAQHLLAQLVPIHSEILIG